jgi:hypothetical protein
MSSLKELDLDLGYFMIIFKEFERPNHVIAPTILQISDKCFIDRPAAG